MPIEIIRESREVETVRYEIRFHYRNDRNCGFSFDCDENGVVDTKELTPAGQANYQSCLDGTYNVECQGIRKDERAYVEPAIGRCSCGESVELGGFTNTCQCGRDYNWNGTLLAPREQWGEETGESWQDIIGI